jgi:molybdopterin/thiamine biosynthesis adenylyltransferase
MSRIGPVEESRFERFSLISWWDQRRLREAKLLVVGAGALGNEIVKNLALFGAGHAVVADKDRIEASNLSRSVLFRERDCGRAKADVACDAAREIYPGFGARPLNADVTYAVGLGLFRWADVVIGALDNREARLAISRFCNLVGRPWVDGGIDVLSGIVRVFVPGDGPCYECTLSEVDWEILKQRRACTLLPRDGADEPRVPTTPSTAAIVAGMQCTEVLKLIHGLDGLRGEGVVYDGRGFDSYRIGYVRDPECYGHDVLPPVEPLDLTSETPVGALVEAVRGRLGRDAVVESCRELVAAIQCGHCGASHPRAAALDALTAETAACDACGRPGAPVLYHRLDTPPCDPSLSLRALGLPPWDVVRARSGGREAAFEIAGDRRRIVGDPS